MIYNFFIKKIKFFIYLLICIFSFSFPLKGFCDDMNSIGMKLLTKAIEFAKTNGEQKAFQEITYGKTFKNKDISIFVVDKNYKIVAHNNGENEIGAHVLYSSKVKQFIDNVFKNETSIAQYVKKDPQKISKEDNQSADLYKIKYAYGKKYKDYVFAYSYFVE